MLEKLSNTYKLYTIIIQLYIVPFKVRAPHRALVHPLTYKGHYNNDKKELKERRALSK